MPGRDTPLGIRFPCSCCGYLTLTETPMATDVICEVCFWEDDGEQFRDLDYPGGANDVGLDEARLNFQTHGASDLRFKSYVRTPLPEEQP